MPIDQTTDSGKKRFEIACRLCHGDSIKEIAEQMEISVQLVNWHLAKLREQFNAKNSCHLVTILLTTGALEYAQEA